MTDRPSLFAQKLRDWRTSHGTHGRVTQEALAEMLGISIDAIGKYERSLSFIRGDLEHRLSERLGWSCNDILTCREDWEARNQRGGQNAYQLLDETLLETHFAGSLTNAINAMIELADLEFGTLPDELAADADVFLPIYETFPENWDAILNNGRIVAKWSLVFLLPEDETRFRQGRLIESELSVDRLRRLLLPGNYFGHCPALIIGKGHEAAAKPLMSSFVRFLERLAERDIFLSGLGTISVSAGGAQVCRDLGMEYLGSHCVDASFGVWELPGSAIADSIFARRSSLLRQRYAEVFTT